MLRASLVPLFLAAAALPACGSDSQNLFKDSSGGSGGGGASSHHGSTTSASSTGTGGAGGASTSSSGTGAGGGAVAPGIISQSDQSALESETHVAVAPNGFVCATWIAEQPGGGSTNGYRFSTDGGATWQPVSHVASPSPEVASDPVLAIDQENDFYLTWVGFQFDQQGQPFDMHVYVAKAAAGATSFGAPIEVTSNPGGGESYDKPWITVTNKDTVLVTYAVTSTGALRAARSTNGAQSFGTATIVQDGQFRNLMYPCAPATGDRVWVTYVVPQGGIGLRWSDDDGVTWPDANKTAVADNGEVPAFDDPTCAAEGSDVWVAYGLSMDGFSSNNSPKLTAVRVAHSGDGGVTIDARVDAHDTSAGAYFMHPQLVREPGGAFDLVYYAGQGDNDANASFRRSRSVDGATWDPSAVVKAPILFVTDRMGGKWLGDYVGLAFAGGSILTTYADNTVDMYSHIGFAKVAVQ
ncbi:MAG TPA: sialidase family protein [Minicystis sp.]|nr:sialidase family protein [Minicystis sp.]